MPPRDEATTGDPGAAAEPAPRAFWSWRRWVLAVICVGLLAVAVRAEGPLLTESLHSFAHLRWGLVVWAVLLETVSMVALGLMERRILILGGLELSAGRSIAIAYASNALSESLPVVGSGAATAYSYRRLVSQGATPALAGWALTLSGVASNVAYVLIICIGGLVSGNIFGAAAGVVGTVLTAAVVVVTVIAVRRPPVRERVSRAVVWTLSRVQRLIRRPARDAAEIVEEAMASLGGFAANRQDVASVAFSAVRNWGCDLFCLTFSIRAAGAHIPWWGIILAWAAGTGGASLNLTPGGLGVVEATLTGALVAVGLPARPALTAVLVYRAISFWLAIAIGWPIYWRLRRDEPQPVGADLAAEPRGDDHSPNPDQPTAK